MIDDDRVGRVKKRMKSLRNVGELHFQAVEDLHEIPIAVDQLSLMRVLYMNQSGGEKEGERDSD